MKKTPLKQSGRLRARSKTYAKTRKVKRQTEKELWDRYGLKKPHKPRFVGLQGILWYVVSRYIRKSEFIKYRGRCVDGCGRTVQDWREADCGHFRASSRGFSTRFVRENLALQTKYCNNPLWSPDSAYGFGLEIDRRYGKGTAERLEKLSYKTTPEYSPQEYDREIRRYIKLFDEC